VPPHPGPDRGPSPLLPLAYLVCAAAAFLAAALGVVWLAPQLAGHYYHPRILALTHTVTLGWITLAIMGASYQIAPVVLERPIWSERLARWQLGVLAVTVTGMIAHFYLGTWRGLAAAGGSWRSASPCISSTSA
jgi:cbb3-type cytochrome oxidase subunit 1